VLSIDLDIGDVVFKDSGDIDLYAALVHWVRYRCVTKGWGKPKAETARHEPPRRDAVDNCGARAVGVVKLTSGKVPLENTLVSSQVSRSIRRQLAKSAAGKKGAASRWTSSSERETHINRQVLPQAPSPTMTNFLRSSAAIVVNDQAWIRGHKLLKSWRI
jgi:hypothetical protein